MIIGALSIIFFCYFVLTSRLAYLIYQRQLKHDHDYDQMEYLLSIHSAINTGNIIPKTRGYAGSPDFIMTILLKILETTPRNIIETGSGSSSLLISEFLTNKGLSTDHIALEDQKKYYDGYYNRLASNKSKIIYAPLKTYQIDQQSYEWYDITGLDQLEYIDLLVIDGPAKKNGKNIRQDALTILNTILHVSPRMIIIDDTQRTADHDMAMEWAADFHYNYEKLPLEKGCIILTKQEM